MSASQATEALIEMIEITLHLPPGRVCPCHGHETLPDDRQERRDEAAGPRRPREARR